MKIYIGIFASDNVVIARLNSMQKKTTIKAT